MRGWMMRDADVEANIEFQSECLRFFDRGHDTYDIAKLMFKGVVLESQVCRALRIARERRRAEQGEAR